MAVTIPGDELNLELAFSVRLELKPTPTPLADGSYKRFGADDEQPEIVLHFIKDEQIVYQCSWADACHRSDECYAPGYSLPAGITLDNSDWLFIVNRSWAILHHYGLYYISTPGKPAGRALEQKNTAHPDQNSCKQTSIEADLEPLFRRWMDPRSEPIAKIPPSAKEEMRRTDKSASEQLLEDARQSPPDWGDQLIQCRDDKPYWDRAGFSGFEVSDTWSDMASINVFQVVGCTDPYFTPRSWQEMLERACLRPALDKLDSQPDFYLNTSFKYPMLQFLTFDGVRFFADRDALPWIVVARYLFAEKGVTHLHGVTIKHIQIDEPFYQLYGQLQQALSVSSEPVYLSINQELLGREDAAGWKTDFYRTTLIWEEGDGQIELDIEAARDRLQWLQRKQMGFLGRIFGRRPPSYSH